LFDLDFDQYPFARIYVLQNKKKKKKKKMGMMMMMEG
jgi:hypothetical protein